MFILLPLPTLSLIADLPAQAAQMRQHKEGFRLASSPEATFEFITTVDEGTREFTAPAAFNSVPDLLVLADYGPTDLASTYFDRMSRAIFDFSFQRQQVVVLLRVPAMTDSCSGDGGHHRSEATQAGGLLYRLSVMVPRGIGLAHRLG